MRKRFAALVTAAAAVAGLAVTAGPAQAANRYGIEIDNPDGKCLDIPGSNFSAGVGLQAYSCNHTNAQKWNLVHAGSRYFKLQSVGNPALCAYNQYNRDQQGDRIVLGSCDSNSALFNEISPDWNDYWQFQPKAAFKNCVNYAGGSNQGAWAVLYPCSDRAGNSLFDLWNSVFSEN
ncbi:RICIN domain-containing protein [Streptomyces sp. NPDC093225]|uniref:RICIN domain-containing protein n=1 Tax=Streptomyces sp. NPDC093225 TaxID=3366034 RepID=UPI0037F1C718